MDSFVPIAAFNSCSGNALPEAVESDHVPLIINMNDDESVMVENISNPTYHCYFGLGENHPLKNTHMYVPKPYDQDGKMDASLATKTLNQVARISDSLIQGDVSAYVIIEGFKGFYQSLANRLACPFISTAGFYSFPPDHQQNPGFTIVCAPIIDNLRNVVGMAINNATYAVLYFNVLSREYNEEQDAGSRKKLTLPISYLQSRGSGKKLLLVGVHISGCASQFPKSGLQELARQLISLHYAHPGADILAVGDYNCPPCYVDAILVNEVRRVTDVQRLPSTYLTHVNPNCQAAVYDHAVVVRARSYRLGSISELPVSGRSLVTAINRSATLYAKTNSD